MESNGQPVWLDRKTVRDRIDAIDNLMLLLIQERLFLVGEVGKDKHAKGESLQASDREAAMFAKKEAQCSELGLNFDFIAELWSTIIHYAKVEECKVVGIPTFLDQKQIAPDELRKNLLKLTEAAAPVYDDYCNGKGADAAKAYRKREMHAIRRAIKKGLSGHHCALDLGCASGQITEELEQFFTNVRAFDFSPSMVTEARKRREWKEGVTFEEADLSAGIPADDGSVDFLVANFGCASELGPRLLPEVRRVLKPGGKAVLSYYNNEALLNYWFYPWPATVRARLNRHNGTLEVWTDNKVFTIEAVGTTVSDLQKQLRGNGLQVVDGCIESYPTIQSIVPRFFFNAEHSDAEMMTQIAAQIDDHLARSTVASHSMYRGTYILTEVRKKVA